MNLPSVFVLINKIAFNIVLLVLLLFLEFQAIPCECSL